MNTNNGTATRLSEHILFWLVERLYHTEVAHTEEMKNAVREQECYEAHRANEFAEAVAAAAAMVSIGMERTSSTSDAKWILDRSVSPTRRAARRRHRH
jgi:hypothetical protein